MLTYFYDFPSSLSRHPHTTVQHTVGAPLGGCLAAASFCVCAVVRQLLVGAGQPGREYNYSQLLGGDESCPTLLWHSFVFQLPNKEAEISTLGDRFLNITQHYARRLPLAQRNYVSFWGSDNKKK